MANTKLKSTPKSLPTAEWILWLIVLFLAVRAAYLVHSEFVRVTCPCQVQQDEALHVDFGRRIALGESPYVDFRNGGPYVHCSYPPLYYLLMALGLRHGVGLFESGRWVSWFGFFALLAMLFFWTFRRSAGPWKFLGPLLVANAPTWVVWGTVDRSDALSIAFNLASLLVWMLVVEQQKPESRKAKGAAWIAGLLHALALLTKQTTLLLGVAVLAAGIVRKRPKTTGAFLLAAWGTAGLAAGLLVLGTHGLFWDHTVVWARSYFEWTRLAEFLVQSWAPECGALAILGVLALWKGTTVPLILRILLTLETLSLFSLGRVGSAENYYMEFLLVLVLVLGEALSRPDPNSGKSIRWVIVGLLAVTLFQWGLQKPRVPGNTEINQKHQAAALLEGHGPVLLIDSDLALMSGREVWYHPSTFQVLFAMRAWDASTLVREIKEHRLDWAEVYDEPDQGRIPTPVIQALAEDYRIVSRSYGRLWLKPKAGTPQKP